MTKLEKLRENLECDVIELNEAWSEFEKERKATDTNSSSLEKSESSNSSQTNARSDFHIK